MIIQSMAARMDQNRSGTGWEDLCGYGNKHMYERGKFRGFDILQKVINMSRSERVSEITPHVNKMTTTSRLKKVDSSQHCNSFTDRVMFLQRTVGNQGVERMIRSGTLQVKLNIGQPGDQYEQEADRVAEHVMRMPEPQSVSGNNKHIQRACPKCEENELKRQPAEDGEEKLQTKTASVFNPEVDPGIENQIQSIKGGGNPLSESDRAFFEPRFGADFSQVRVHTDSQAAESARAVNARAFTMGHDVVFGKGEYAPGTHEGRRLLGHELTHTIQQNASSLQLSGPRIQRAAASCPSAWNTTVRNDHNRALNMINIARGKLSSYDGTNPPEVKTALLRNFKASSSGFAGWVNMNLGLLRLMAPLASYDCEDTNSWWCGPNTLAKTFWCVPGFDIRVCQPLYFSASDLERSATLIHEWVHKYGCNFDLGYSGDPDYPRQWTISALLNADPFSEFVKDVQ